jgi:hypothetical protein
LLRGELTAVTFGEKRADNISDLGPYGIAPCLALLPLILLGAATQSPAAILEILY